MQQPVTRNAMIISIYGALACASLWGSSKPLLELGSWGSETVQIRWQCTIGEDGQTTIRVVDGSGGTRLSTRLSGAPFRKLTDLVASTSFERFQRRYEAPASRQETYFLRAPHSGSSVIVLYGPHLMCSDPDVNDLISILNSVVELLPESTPSVVRPIECSELGDMRQDRLVRRENDERP